MTAAMIFCVVGFIVGIVSGWICMTVDMEDGDD